MQPQHDVRNKVVAMGGSFDVNLTTSTTHLVAASSDTEKYRVATGMQACFYVFAPCHFFREGDLILVLPLLSCPRTVEPANPGSRAGMYSSMRCSRALYSLVQGVKPESKEHGARHRPYLPICTRSSFVGMDYFQSYAPQVAAR